MRYIISEKKLETPSLIFFCYFHCSFLKSQTLLKVVLKVIAYQEVELKYFLAIHFYVAIIGERYESDLKEF